MSWLITYSADATAALKKMPSNLSKVVVKKINALAADPYTPNNNVKALKGQARSYRLRVGDWRVIYTLHDDVLLVLVLKIGPRGGVYD